MRFFYRKKTRSHFLSRLAPNVDTALAPSKLLMTKAQTKTATPLQQYLSQQVQPIIGGISDLDRIGYGGDFSE